jgi:hypothetical protein
MDPKTYASHTFQQTVSGAELPRNPRQLAQIPILLDPDNLKRYCMMFDHVSYQPSYLAALARKQFDEGYPVSCGTVTVSKQGVYDGHKLHSWNDIVDVQLTYNGISITEKSSGTPQTIPLPITTEQDSQVCLSLIQHALK